MYRVVILLIDYWYYYCVILSVRKWNCKLKKYNSFRYIKIKYNLLISYCHIFTFPYLYAENLRNGCFVILPIKLQRYNHSLLFFHCHYNWLRSQVAGKTFQKIISHTIWRAFICKITLVHKIRINIYKYYFAKVI